MQAKYLNNEVTLCDYLDNLLHGDSAMIKKIKSALNIKTNRELAALLGIHESQITRWSKTGFHKSTEALLELLLEFAESKT